MKQIDFWFSIGSTYTYLAVMRLNEFERAAGVAFDWKPFSVRALMQEMDNIPFIGKPAKEKYMWRDVQRRAEKYGFPVNFPIEYPLTHFDLANRVAVVAKQEGWCAEYVRTTYRLWFQEQLPAGSKSNLSEGLKRIGHSPNRVLDVANSEPVEEACLGATSDARSLGVFGSPTFVIDVREIFWGDDRLEDAVDWASRSLDSS